MLGTITYFHVIREFWNNACMMLLLLSSTNLLAFYAFCSVIYMLKNFEVSNLLAILYQFTHSWKGLLIYYVLYTFHRTNVEIEVYAVNNIFKISSKLSMVVSFLAHPMVLLPSEIPKTTDVTFWTYQNMGTSNLALP